MKKLNLAMFLCVSILGSASAMATTMPAPTGNPQNISQAVSSAYLLGKAVGPHLSISHNNRWTTNDATNGIGTLKYLAKETANNMNKKLQSEGFIYRISESKLYKMLFTQYSEGVYNSNSGTNDF